MRGQRFGYRRFVTLATVLAVLVTTTSIATIGAVAQDAPPTQGWGWGDDEFGQLGIGDQNCFDDGDDFCPPTRLDYEDDDLRQIDGGNEHGVALDADGAVFNWGRGAVLAGTDGSTTTSPTHIGDPADGAFVAVAAGDEHTLALAQDGTVWSWGRNDEGQLGHGYLGSDPSEPDPEFPYVNDPAQVIILFDPEGGTFPLTNIVAIAAGGSHSLALDGEGNVWAWGANFQGQLANGNAEESIPFARRALVDDEEPLSNVVHIAAGENHSLAVADFGEVVVFGWGSNSSGQLGYINGSMEVFASQGLILLEPVRQLAGGDEHSLVLTGAGQILAAGGNDAGQLGNGSVAEPNDGFLPVIDLEAATGIAAHGDSSYAIQDRQVFAWGDNSTGQLGSGNADPPVSATPGEVTGLPEAFAVGAGRFSGHAVTAEAEQDPYELTLLVEDEVEGIVGGPGVTDLDLSTVDIGALPLFQGELASAPLRSSPLRSSPLRSSPLRSSPLRSSPLRSSPLRSSPLRSSPLRSSEVESTPLRSSPLRSSPLRSSPLRSSPLSELPLLLDGGWSAILDGTPYAGVALQSVRFGDVLDLEPSPLEDLSIDDVDWSNSALKRASIVGFLFGGLTLDQLGGAAQFCAALPAGFCADNGLTGSSTLLEIDLAGAPMQDLTFLPAIQIDAINWSAGNNTPAYHYDLLFVDVDESPVGAITLDLLPPGLVDCDPSKLDPTIIDCSDPTTATLSQAVAAGAIPPYELGDPQPAILGRILENSALVPSVTGPLTIGDVLPMLIDPAKLNYGGVSLFRLLAGQPVAGNLVSYSASAVLDCDDVDDFTMRVTLPPGFRYAPGSAAVNLDGGELIGDVPEPPEAGLAPDLGVGEEPTPQKQPLTFAFDDVITCSNGGSSFVELSFEALPFVMLGSFPASLDLIIDGGETPVGSIESAAAYTVIDPFEDVEFELTRPVETGSLYLGWLAGGDQADEFVIELDGSSELQPGTMVTAVLSHLPADFDLRIDGPASAPLRSSPLRSSPLRSSPLRSSPIEDEGLSGDPDGQQVPSDTLQDIPNDEDTLSLSANRGTEQDVVTTVVTASTANDPLTLAVSSYLGSASDQPYSLQVFVDPPPELNCDPVALDRVGAFAGGTTGELPTPSLVPSDTRTLVLYNQQRLEALYGAAELADVLDALAELEADPEAKAVLLAVDGDADVRSAYADWDADPCSPEAANDVVRSILEVTDPYVTALADLRYVTIVGSDDIVPSARIPDLVTLSNQRDYYPELVFGGVDNPLSAAQAMSYVTSDSAYTDLDPIDWLGHELLVPDLAGGRLVETPAEIVGAIDRYVAQPYVATDRSLVTAYDFLTHGGQDTQETFEALVGSTAARALISEDWDRQDVRDELLLEPDLIAINAHYDHSRSLPAIGDQVPIPNSELFSSSDLLGSLSGDGALYFTVGCNAGINVPALSGVGLPAGHERVLDWAQAVAQLPGSGFLGNTGFGYGDTEYSAYSERLMSLFATFLDGSMTVGQASVAARKAYIAERGLLGVYDDKVLTEATLYGLPFVRVGATGGSLPADEVGDPFAGTPDTGPIAPDPTTGIDAAPFDLDVDHDLEQTDRGDFYRVGDHPPLSVHYRPLQPSMQLTLPAPGQDQAIGDVLITGLTSDTVPLTDPVFVRPTVDSSEFEPEPNIRNLGFPSTIGTVTPEASLIVLPGQYRGDEVASSTGQQILHTDVTGKVFYPDDGGGAPATDAARPFFRKVDGLRQVNSVFFEVEVDPAEYVLVLYRQPGTGVWGSLELTRDGDGVWRGSVSPQDQVLEFFVQAVSADGLVGAARGKGFDFVPRLGDIEAPTIDITVPAPGQTFAVDEVVSAQYTCADEEGGTGIDVCTAWDPVLEQPTSDLLDTSPGVRTFSVYARDTAGNEHVETVTYGAGYAFEGFFEPVKNPPVVNEMKAGRSIPLKFRLSDANGVVGDTAVIEHVVVRASSVCGNGAPSDPIEDVPTESTAGLTYDAANQQFVYTWATDKKGKGCFEVEVKTVDGATYVAWFKLK